VASDGIHGDDDEAVLLEPIGEVEGHVHDLRDR
jgi:hypothetical protein